jgi:Protein of unknown function (DUF982)
MRNEAFDVTVTIRSSQRDEPSAVTHTVQAAQLLLDRWPEDRRGPKYRAALRACMDVIEQRRAVASARKAFIAAAREAHLLVPKPKH